MRKPTTALAATDQTDVADLATAPAGQEQPRVGGSFVRQEDGSLQMVEGAIAADAGPAEADTALAVDDDAPPTDAASLPPATSAPADAGTPTTDQHEG